MPYNIRKQKCKQSDGDFGDWVLSYTDKSGKKHRACHTSKKKAKGQIAAIEMRREAEESSNESLIESVIRELINEEIETTKKGDSMKEQRVRVTERQLRRMIRETLQREGFMDSVKGALGIGGGKKLNPSDLQGAYNDLKTRSDVLSKEIMQLVDRGQRPSNAGKGLQLSRGMVEVAGIRAVLTVLDHALQALGAKGSGVRLHVNPWVLSEQGDKLEWRDMSGGTDPMNYYLAAIRNGELFSSGRSMESSMVEKKVDAYLRELGENEAYVTARLMDAIQAIEKGQTPKHREPKGNLDEFQIDALNAAVQTWQ